jgi:hypothetical protein
MATAAPEQRARGLRLVNIEIRSMVPEHDAFDPEEWDFFCECGECDERVRLLPASFDLAVAQAELVLAPGHVFTRAEESKALQAQARQAIKRVKESKQVRAEKPYG